MGFIVGECRSQSGSVTILGRINVIGDQPMTTGIPNPVPILNGQRPKFFHIFQIWRLETYFKKKNWKVVDSGEDEYIKVYVLPEKAGKFGAA